MRVEKVLSSNDTGETGSHQAGILIPKGSRILSFFPELDAGSRNPDAMLKMLDDLGQEWVFRFIYYNNRRFGGTRDEYRLTRMTRYTRANGLKAGDSVVFRRDSAGRYRVSHRRDGDAVPRQDILELTGKWKVIRISRG